MQTADELSWLTDADDFTFHPGDFNADGRQDLLAVSAQKQAHCLMHSGADGRLSIVQTLKKNVKWGKNNTDSLLIADYNGDGRDDITALSQHKNKKHYVIFSDDNGLLDTKHTATQGAKIADQDWDTDTHSVVIAGSEAELVKLYNETGGIDENSIETAKANCSPNCGHQAYTVTTASTAMVYSVAAIPSTPSSYPGTSGSSYKPVYQTHDVTMPAVSGATYYQLYESTHNSTSLAPDSSYQQVSSGSAQSVNRTPNSAGYRWYKYKACNSSGCSGLSPCRRLYVYGSAGYPNNLSISPTNINTNTNYTVSWTSASGAVDGTVYSLYENEQLIYSVTRNHWSENSYSHTTASAAAGTLAYRVQACSPGVNCGPSRTVYQTVSQANSPPVATADTWSTNEDTPVYIPVKSNDSDANGDALTVTLYGSPSHGSVQLSGDSIYYSPTANFNGNDSFSYRVYDTSGAYSNVATVSVMVNPTNDTPTGSVTISGETQVGQTLTATPSISDVDGLGTITYQWYRQGLTIAAATASTYVLHANDYGSTLTVRASYRDGGGTNERVDSAATTVIQNAAAQFQLLFIHTDLTGSPVAETNTTGALN